MSNKRGFVLANELKDIIIGALIFIVLLGILFMLFSGIRAKLAQDCQNEQDFNKLIENIEKVDKNEVNNIQVPFRNADCKLASFTLNQNKIINPSSAEQITENPQLCLCEIKNNECKTKRNSDCYTFNNVKKVINAEDDQVTTARYNEGILFLDLVKEGDILLINIFGQKTSFVKSSFINTKENETLVNNVFLKKLDLLIRQTDPIEIQPELVMNSQPDLLPNEIERKGNFPLFFDIEVKNKLAQNVINPEQVEEAEFMFGLNLDDINSAEELADKLSLYYKIGGAWLSSKLVCENKETSSVCTTKIDGFSKEFAISTKTRISPGISDEDILNLDKVSDVTQKIVNIAKSEGVPPGLATAVAYTESRLKHRKEDGSVTKSKDGRDTGLFQLNEINKKKYDCNFEDINCNIVVGVDILRGCYAIYGNKQTTYKGCLTSTHDQVYTGWDAALRCYNGWPKSYTCAGDPGYVAHVTENYERLSPELKQEDTKYGLV